MKRLTDSLALILIFAVALALPVGAGAAEMREWTRASDGKAIEAEYAGMANEKEVRLRMTNGRVYDVPLATLSEADNDYVAGLLENGGGAEGADMKEGDPGGESGDAGGAVSLTLSGVHLCCSDCEDAVAGLASGGGEEEGATRLEPDRDAGTVAVTAPSALEAEMVLKKLFRAGFYGVSDHDSIALPVPEEDDFTANTMPLRNLHLCCGKCVRELTGAVESVEGVDEVDAEEGSTEAMVKGEQFRPYDIMVALREAGFGGSYR